MRGLRPIVLTNGRCPCAPGSQAPPPAVPSTSDPHPQSHQQILSAASSISSVQVIGVSRGWTVPGSASSNGTRRWSLQGAAMTS